MCGVCIHLYIHIVCVLKLIKLTKQTQKYLLIIQYTYNIIINKKQQQQQKNSKQQTK